MKNINTKLGAIVQNPVVVLLSYIISFASFFVSCNDNIILNSVFHGFIALYLVILTIYIAKRYFSIKTFKDNLIFQSYNDSKEIYESLLEFSDDIVDKTLKVQKNKTMESDHFKDIIKNICSIIRRTVKKTTGEDFSVCIKSFSQTELMETDYLNMSTITLARDSDSFVKRSVNDNEKQKIADNTSFTNLLKEGALLWACPNLKSIDPQLVAGATYKNPDGEYRKYYNSTVVVPIRTKIENVCQTILEYSNTNNAKYHYLGFLCVDSMQTFQEDQIEFNKLCNLLVALGPALYPLLENYLKNEIEGL